MGGIDEGGGCGARELGGWVRVCVCSRCIEDIIICIFII